MQWPDRTIRDGRDRRTRSVDATLAGTGRNRCFSLIRLELPSRRNQCSPGGNGPGRTSRRFRRMPGLDLSQQVAQQRHLGRIQLPFLDKLLKPIKRDRWNLGFRLAVLTSFLDRPLLESPHDLIDLQALLLHPPATAPRNGW